MKYRECAQLLTQQDQILILTHRDPDGDAAGSAAALCSALRRMGKTAWLFPNPGFTRKVLPYIRGYLAPADFVPACTVSVDVAAERMFPSGFEGKVFLCIDHHGTNSHFGLHELVQGEKSSCGEIILELIKTLCGNVTEEEATLLYIAITTDTGCFQYSNTSCQTLSSASELLRLGAKQHEVSQTFFRKVSLARIQLEGMIYSGMRFYRDGKIVVATVTQEMIRRSGAGKDDYDDLASLAGRVEGSEVNITIREQEDGSSRVSVRSNPGISSSDICAAFGGGGHEMAAGCNIPCPPEKARSMLLDVISELYP